MIEVLCEKYYSESVVSAKASCSNMAVHTAIVAFTDKERNRRQRKTRWPFDEYIATRWPTRYCQRMCASLFHNRINASSMIVSFCLRFEFGLKSFKPTGKTRLTSITKPKHQGIWCLYEVWIVNQWRNVIRWIYSETLRYA